MKKKDIIEIFKKNNIEAKKIKLATNSYNSKVYIVNSTDEEYIFKISKTLSKRINEAKYYNYLYDFVPTSKVIDSGTYGEYEYNIFTKFEGKSIFDEECNNLDKNAIFEVGKLLAKIHSCKIIDKDDDSWITYLNNCLDKTSAVTKEIFTKKDNDLIYDTLNNYINKKIKNNYKNSICHMDFRIGNVIFGTNHNVGIIDLESMKNGDYIFDFVKMNRIFNKRNFNILLNGYKEIKELDDFFDDKLNFYSFFDSYTSLYWCVINNQQDTDFYKLNYKITKKFLGEIKNGKWNIQ
ncbi:MAG: phosphotransferase [Bacilli bacterium]